MYCSSSRRRNYVYSFFSHNSFNNSQVSEFQYSITKVHEKAPCFTGDWVVGGYPSKGEHNIYIWDTKIKNLTPQALLLKKEVMSSLAIPSTNLKFRVHRFRRQPSHLCRSSKTYLPHQTLYTRTNSIKASVADNNEPNEVKMQIGIMKKKFKEVMPSPVQEFPWRKAQHTLLDRLPLFVQEALKWSLIAYFIITSLSDVVYTFSINRELIIPVGLFVGCLMADFLKEISLELFHQFEEIDLKWRRLGLCGLFVLVKFTSTWFSIQSGVFLLHVANGGLLQLLWYWRNFMEDAKKRKRNEEPF